MNDYGKWELDNAIADSSAAQAAAISQWWAENGAAVREPRVDHSFEGPRIVTSVVSGGLPGLGKRR